MKSNKKSTKSSQTKPTKEVVTDVGAMVDKAKADKAARRVERKARKAERKAAQSTTRGGGRDFPAEPNGFTLKQAKLYAREESKQHRRPIYVNVDPKGDFEISLRYDSKSSLHCFRNGSEVAMIVPTKTTESKQENKQSSGDVNSKEVMSTTKKAAKVSGQRKAMSGKDIIALLKKGARVVNAKGRLCNMKKIAARIKANPAWKKEVIVQKA